MFTFIHTVRDYLLLPIVMAITLVSCNSNEEEGRIKPTRQDVAEYVYASAKVVSKDTYSSRPSRSGIIQEVYVKEGDRVKKGQPLFKIETAANSKNSIEIATTDLKEADENLYGYNSQLKSIELEIEQTKSQNLIDSTNYSRRQKLWNQEIGSKNELEKALLTYQSSTKRLQGLKLDYEQTKVRLKSYYDKAESRLSTEQNVVSDYIIKSQIDGYVFFVDKVVGEYISPQEIFATIGSGQNFIVEMDIDEIDISRIEIGETVIIELEAYTNEVYTSILNYISPIKNEITQTFMVEGTFVDPPKKLFDGLSGEGNILIAKRKDAIIIPSEYLLESNKVLTDEGTLNVVVGVRNIDYTEILEGIDTSTVLIKPDR